MGEAALIALINQNYPDQFVGLINPAKERETLIALVREIYGLADQADAGDFIFNENTVYELNDLVVYNDKWYRSLQNDNDGNFPPVTGSNAFWTEIGSFSQSIKLYETGVYLSNPALVVKDNDLFILNRSIVGTEPFDSQNFALELSEDIWVALTFNLPQSTRDALIGTMGTPNNLNRFVTAEGLEFEVGAINTYIENLETQIDNLIIEMENAGIVTGRRIVNLDFVLNSPTAGVISAEWFNDANGFFTVSGQNLSFAGLAAEGLFRKAIVELLEDGTVNVKESSESLTPDQPAPTAGAIIAVELLFSSESVQSNEGGGTVWSLVRYGTRIEANTTDKYAKIYDGPLSYVNNYQFVLVYGGTGEIPQKVGTLNVGFLCDTNSNIRPESVNLETRDKNSADGDFVLVQLPNNRVGLFHKSTQYWGRVRFRVVFQNEAVNLNNFIHDSQYLALPSGTNWQSKRFAGEEVVERTGTNVKFDKNSIHGNAGAVSGNITFDFTGEQLGKVCRMIHNSGTVPSIPGAAVPIAGKYEVNKNNYIWFCITKTGTGRIVEMTIGQRVNIETGEMV